MRLPSVQLALRQTLARPDLYHLALPPTSGMTPFWGSYYDSGARHRSLPPYEVDTRSPGPPGMEMEIWTCAPLRLATSTYQPFRVCRVLHNNFIVTHSGERVKSL